MGPNISEKFVPGGTNFKRVQIKRDRTQGKNQRSNSLESSMLKPKSLGGGGGGVM